MGKVNGVKSRCWFIVVALWFYSPILLAKALFPAEVVDHAKKSVVTIEVNGSFVAYGKGCQWSGTGCVVDKQRGIILTNQHLVGGAVVGNYKVTFFNGIQREVSLIYYDAWLDYGFLQVAPEAIPQEVTETSFSKHNPVIDQPIFMVGNNENHSFSFHTGVVADLYDIMGGMPQQSIKLSLNSRGGSSGSPIFNRNGQAIALNYAGNETFGFALHPAYIRYALSAIRQGKGPIRKHIGVITKSVAIGDLVRYNALPPSVQKAYIQTFPHTATTVVQVHDVLPHSPAAALLLPGDVIWAVDGQQIGPNLVTLDMAMNKTTKDYVLLTIFRNGQKKAIPVKLYNPDDHKVTKMVYFGGVIFFESDDYYAQLSGIPAKSLTFVKQVDENHIFHNVAPCRFEKDFRINLLAFNEQSLVDLDALVVAIPFLIAKKYFTIDYVDLAPFYGYNNRLYLSPRLSKSYVEYGAYLSPPRLFSWDEAHHQWTIQAIP